MTQKINTANTILICIIMIMFAGKATTFAQVLNLTAAQNYIYFGQPKKLTTQDNSGTTVTQFDMQGRITSVSQGNMRIEYDWTSDDMSVTVSQYNGQNLQDGGIIEINEFTKILYKYKIGETSVIVKFRKNGAIEKTEISNTYISAILICYYRDSNDMYPYAIEQSMGDQSMKCGVTINKTDSYGNPIEITQDMMGQKLITQRSIEYY